MYNTNVHVTFPDVSIKAGGNLDDVWGLVLVLPEEPPPWVERGANPKP